MKSRSAAACKSETAEPLQLTIFTPLSQRIVDRIAETDINSSLRCRL